MKKKSLLTIAPKSEFQALVPVPCPDRNPEEVQFTFRYRNREQLDEWILHLEAKAGRIDANAIDADVDMVMGAATGWELEEEFTESNVRELLKQHPGAAMAVYQQYVTLSRVGKQKN